MKKSLYVLAFGALTLGLVSCDSSSSKNSNSTSNSGPVSVISGGSQSASSEESYVEAVWTGKVKIYYHNDAANYANKRIWAWGSGVDGFEYMFDNQTTSADDDFGVYKIFDMSAAPWKGNVTTTLSFIIKEAGSWSGQSTDTVISFGRYVSHAVDGLITIYSSDGEGGNIDTYVKKEDALGDRLATASFSSWQKIHVTGGGTKGTRTDDEVGKVATYRLYGFDNSYYLLADDEKITKKETYFISTGAPSSNAFDIDLASTAKPSTAYIVEAYMSADTGKKKSKTVGFTALFDTNEFKNTYTYTGNDLGCVPTHTASVFKLWAPTSSRVQLKIFMSGTPADLIVPFDPTRNWGTLYEMKLGDRGVWQIEVKDDLLSETLGPYFYTYIVTNSAGSNEVCDPYAKATGVNGRRAFIVDSSTLQKPTDWDKIDTYGAGSLLPKLSSPNELSVYEIHVRDLTIDKTWISNKANKNGTYGAFSEKGTTYSADGKSVKTGRDNISEMKFNAIQLLPVFDQDNDERWLDKNGDTVTADNVADGITPPSYNWGYNPLNYNVVEGAYCTDPFTPTVRMNEFRNLVKNYADDGIRVIMDVVYNHVSSVNNSNFTKIVPFYYFRTNAQGFYTNGSGVGNETATERPMMRKVIVDSLVWWASFYKIKGFRFDVMGVIDGETMKAASRALYAVDPQIVLYGEGWTADGSANMNDKSGKRAVAASCYTSLYPGQADCPIGVGCFNSPGKQALKGEEHLGWGFMNRGSDYNDDPATGVNGVTYMLNGHMWNNGDLDYANPTQTVNYASCHDNYTNYDQFNYTVGTGPDSAADSTVAMEASIASMAAVLFSEGIAFNQGGEEIFRQKVMKSDNEYYDKITEGDYVSLGNGDKLVRNSYAYGDEVNAFKWDRKVAYYSYFQKFQAACLARDASKADILGRQYDATSKWGAKGITGWNDPITHGCGIAYQMNDDTSHYYFGFLIGRINSAAYGSTGGTTNVGMGNGTYKIVYDSYGRTGNISVSSLTFTAYQNEFLLIRNY